MSRQGKLLIKVIHTPAIVIISVTIKVFFRPRLKFTSPANQDPKSAPIATIAVTTGLYL